MAEASNEQNVCQSLAGCKAKEQGAGGVQFRNAKDTDGVVKRVCNACGQRLQRLHKKQGGSATPAAKQRVPGVRKRVVIADKKRLAKELAYKEKLLKTGGGKR